MLQPPIAKTIAASHAAVRVPVEAQLFKGPKLLFSDRVGREKNAELPASCGTFKLLGQGKLAPAAWVALLL